LVAVPPRLHLPLLGELTDTLIPFRALIFFSFFIIVWVGLGEPLADRNGEHLVLRLAADPCWHCLMFLEP
jgi:hypothetical protein